MVMGVSSLLVGGIVCLEEGEDAARLLGGANGNDNIIKNKQTNKQNKNKTC